MVWVLGVLWKFPNDAKSYSAASTKLLHMGQTPESSYMALNQSRIKRDLITKAKMAKSPARLGVVGESSN
jgi:hypothetical protein